jgi:ATP-binding cassette subfamily C protein
MVSWRATHQSELLDALRQCRGALVGVAIMSGALNLLALTGSFFMLQVYDRVIPSRSVQTLIGLTGLMVGLYVFQGVLDALRMRILGWIGVSLDEQLGLRFFDISCRLALQARPGQEGPLAQRDLDQVRNFLSGVGPCVLFDLPWMPLYFAICFIFHPLIGAVAAAGAAILCILTALTERYTVAPIDRMTKVAVERNRLGEAATRHAEVARAMGFASRLGDLWAAANARLVVAQRRVSNVTGGFGSTSKAFRMILQSGILAIGAWLVIHENASPGIMIASSIMTARALAPIELAIGAWKTFVEARQSWRRLEKLIEGIPLPEPMIALPPPKRLLTVERLSVAPANQQNLVLVDVSFEVRAGRAIGVIGTSASGKSSLARALVGVWPTTRGRIMLDGAPLDRWPPEALGRHIGYLPQAVALLPGTIAQNIARFEPDPDSRAIIDAAKAAGAHEMILGLPKAYETQIGDGNSMLSAGQRQRIALAVALFRDPFLVVLDEPNSNLDAEGEAALAQAIQLVRARRGIVVVIAHRTNVLNDVDFLLVLDKGRMDRFVEMDHVLRKTGERAVIKATGNVTQLERR